MQAFFERVKQAIRRFMTGRHGADQLSLTLLITGIVFSLLYSMTGFGLFNLLNLVCYVLCLYRIFSRDNNKRNAENLKFLNATAGVRKEARAFINRQKNRKDYKYFRCPKCHALIRLRRGTGEVRVHCPRCGESFSKKA